MKTLETMLIPAIIQDSKSKDILMMGYMNGEALKRTIKGPNVWFYSRSKKRLWEKGETSKNYLEVVSITTDCDKEIILQLPRKGKLNDGDILSTNMSNFYVEIIAKIENLLEISSNSKVELIKTAYHQGNRHVEVEIEEDILLTKGNFVIENMLKNFNVDIVNTQKKFFPERGAHSHE